MTSEESTSDYILPDIEITDEETKCDPNTKNILPKQCRICRNPAVGYHYDVASCNGCKAFFRRTVITGRLPNCKFGDKCLEDHKIPKPGTRLCGSCRFSKCEQMGMNPMAIKSEIISKKGNILKMELVKKHNRQLIAVTKEIAIDDEFSKVLSKLKAVENKLDNLFNSRLPKNYVDYRQFTDILAEKPTFAVEQIPNLSFIPDQVFHEYGGLAHNSFLAVVEFAKFLDFFPKLDSETQLKVVRHGALMVRGMMNTERSIRKFHSDCVRRADGSIAGKPMRNYNGIWVEQRKIVQKGLHAFLRNKIDETEYLLLKGIVLCNPAICGLPESAQQILEDERRRYVRSLLTYCLKQYGIRYGPDRLSSILSIMPIMENQQKEEKSFNVILRSFYSNVSILVSPLYDEIMSS